MKEKRNTYKTCDNLNDDKMGKSIVGRNNLVFETTGSGNMTWFLNKEWNPSWFSSLTKKGEEYRVIYAYSMVEFRKLVERN